MKNVFAAESFQRLGRLLNDLSLCTGIKFAIMDDRGREVFTSAPGSPFCRLILECEEGYRRCTACDREAVRKVRETGERYTYRCHAGLYESAIPVIDEHRCVATVLFGQIAGDASTGVKWENIREQTAWHPESERLRNAFMHLRKRSTDEILAVEEVIQACISEVRLQGIPSDNAMNDANRLMNHIETRYYEPNTVQTLCDTLHMGKTRLFGLCHEHYGMTPLQLLTRKRIAVACELLRTTLLHNGEIAERCGFSDENYFVRVFRKKMGEPPGAYRKHFITGAGGKGE